MCARVVDTSRVSVAVSEVATVEGEKADTQTHTRAPDTFFVFFLKAHPTPSFPSLTSPRKTHGTAAEDVFLFLFFVCVELPLSSRHLY